jgi:hypothetical protein
MDNKKTGSLKTAFKRKLAGQPANYSPTAGKKPVQAAAQPTAPPARDYNDIRPNMAIVPCMLIVAIGFLALLIPAIDTYLYFIAGVVVALFVLAYTNNAAKYRFKRLLGVHEGQAVIILAANTNLVVNVDLSYPGFTHWDCWYSIDKTAVRDEGGIPKLYYHQSVPTPIKFPEVIVQHSAEKIGAAQKAHWMIARLIAANEMWDLFKLIMIICAVGVLIGIVGAYLAYDAGQTCKATGAYSEFVMNRTLDVANRTVACTVQGALNVTKYATIP